MQTKFHFLAITSILFLISAAAFAVNDSTTQAVTASVSQMAVIDVTGDPGALQLVAPGTGGQTPANASDNSTYAQYTSTVPSGQTRNITAAIGGSDAAPAGTHLELSATTSGNTNEGTGASITLSSTAQNIVTGIGSAATGTGATDGAQLTYTLVLDTMTDLVAGESQALTVTLTLTDPS